MTTDSSGFWAITRHLPPEISVCETAGLPSRGNAAPGRALVRRRCRTGSRQVPTGPNSFPTKRRAQRIASTSAKNCSRVSRVSNCPGSSSVTNRRLLSPNVSSREASCFFPIQGHHCCQRSRTRDGPSICGGASRRTCSSTTLQSGVSDHQSKCPDKCRPDLSP